jgi:DNA primase
MSKVITLQDLKASLDIIETASLYCELKKVNDTTYKAVINPLREEKTSSLHFYTNTQKFFDFGSNESGDIFDFIARVENISLSDAINRFKDEAYMPRPRPIREKPQPVQNVEVSREQLQKEFDNFETINPADAEHKEELLSINPYWLYDEAHKDDIQLFLSCTRYDRRNKTLVAGWYENSLLNFEMVTYKRRRLNGGKWINRKGTHPNQTAFNRIYADDKPVYIVEGARDALTSILLGLNFIAIPTTSFKNIEAIQSLLKPHDRVILICEDLQGYKAMSNLSQNIPNSRLVTFVSSPSEKIDLSDYVNKNNSIKGVLDAISA